MTCNSAHEHTPLSDTIDSVPRHREGGRANNLSAPPRIGGRVGTRVGPDEYGKFRLKGIWSPDCPTHRESLYWLSYPGGIHPLLYRRNLSRTESEAQQVTRKVQVCWDMCSPGLLRDPLSTKAERRSLKRRREIHTSHSNVMLYDVCILNPFQVAISQLWSLLFVTPHNCALAAERYLSCINWNFYAVELFCN